MTKRTQSLRITRLLKHDRQRVFSALTDPIKMNQWFFGMKHGRAKVTNDLRPGGKYMIEMTSPEMSFALRGTYVEIIPPEKLVFTWTADGLGGDTTVTFDLFKHGAGTKLVLTHELPSDEVAEHREGWIVCFNHLKQFLAGKPVKAAAKAKN